MVIKYIVSGLLLAASALTASAQLNQVNRLPDVDKSDVQKNYTEKNTGFWIAAEANGAYSCRLFNSNFGFAEIDVVGGWRFSEYLRAGIGLGGRYYFDNDKVRFTSSEWAMPIFANVRGNFIPTQYRSVVPFYSFDIGGTVRDGFMIRPGVGLRIGRERSAFLVGLAYTGQDLSSYSKETFQKKRKFVSFINLKLGYEF